MKSCADGGALGRRNDRGRVTAPAPVRLAGDAIEFGFGAAPAVERLGHGIGQRGSYADAPPVGPVLD